MSRKNVTYLGIIFFSLLLTACNNQRPSYSSDTTTQVWLSDVTRRTIREINTTTGTAKATQTVEVKSEKMGKYRLQNNPKTGKPFKLGDKVDQGTVIVRLENQKEVNDIQYEIKEMEVEIAENEWKGQQRVYELGGATEKEVLDKEKSYITSKINRDNAKMELDKLSIRAPFSGVITKLPYYTPDIEVPSGSLIFEIMDYTRMYMEIELPENAMEKVKVGQKVMVTNYTFKSDTLSGQVSQLSPAINESTRTFSGFITIENPNQLLRPGMLAKGEIVTLQKDSVLAIPKEVIKSQRNQRIVYTVERNMAVEKFLKTGISDDTWIEVESGLTDGDKIVTKGYNYLRPRNQVKVMK